MGGGSQDVRQPQITVKKKAKKKSSSSRVSKAIPEIRGSVVTTAGGTGMADTIRGRSEDIESRKTCRLAQFW